MARGLWTWLIAAWIFACVLAVWTVVSLLADVVRGIS